MSTSNVVAISTGALPPRDLLEQRLQANLDAINRAHGLLLLATAWLDEHAGTEGEPGAHGIDAARLVLEDLLSAADPVKVLAVRQ